MPEEIDATQQSLDALYPYLNRADWRIIGAVTEEAGEVQGAYNKMMDGREDKPKNEDDIIQETTQLLACCLIVGKHYGYGIESMMRSARRFMVTKRVQLMPLSERPRFRSIDNG